VGLEWKQFDVVSLRDGIPEAGVSPGTRAVILDVYDDPSRAYEVEVVDEQTGKTVWWGAVTPDKLEPFTS